MATTAQSQLNPTILDLKSRLKVDGKIDALIEMMAEENEILNDMVMVEGNLATGHRTTIRTGLPSATWRRLNYGVQPSKSRTAQITDTIGMLEAYSKVDKSLADLNGNTAEFRLTEARAFIEAMNQEMATTMFYGNEKSDDAQFTGFFARYNASSADKALIGYNVVKVAGSVTPTSGECSSIMLVGWGSHTIHGIYPKGSPVGLHREDKGQQTLTDDVGGEYEGYREHFKWDLGLTVRDWRYGVRIANIDMTDLTKDPATGDLFDALDIALSRMKSTNGVRPVFYCNRDMESLLRRQARQKATYTLTIDQITENKSIVRFNGIPFKRVDALLNNEATVS